MEIVGNVTETKEKEKNKSNTSKFYLFPICKLTMNKVKISILLAVLSVFLFLH